MSTSAFLGGWECVDESAGVDFVERRRFPVREHLMQALQHVDSVGQTPGECGVKYGAESIGFDACESQRLKPSTS